MLKMYIKYPFENDMTLIERWAHITADIVERTGIDEAMIEILVRSFYGKVRQDALLEAVFDERISDWEQHLQRMCAFWSSVALMSGRHHGQPMDKHLPLPVDARHFDRWLTLFGEKAQDFCPHAAAAHFIEQAQGVAESLELGIAGRNGDLLMKRQRLRRSDSEVFLADGVDGEREIAT